MLVQYGVKLMHLDTADSRYSARKVSGVIKDYTSEIHETS